MNKTGKMIIIIVSIVVLSLFEVLIIKGMAGQKQMVEIFVAKADIPQNTMISEKLISTQSFSTDSLPMFGTQNPKEIIGKYTDKALKQGEIISTTRLIKDEDRSLTSEGKVTISIMPNPEDVLGWQLEKGEFVDLLCYLQEGLKFTTIEFQHIKIINIIDTGFRSAEMGELEKKPKYLILEVTPAQAKELVRLKAKGKIVVIGKS